MRFRHLRDGKTLQKIVAPTIMETILFIIFACIWLLSRDRNLLIENLAMRQQLAIMKQKNKRPKIRLRDRISRISRFDLLYGNFSFILLVCTSINLHGILKWCIEIVENPEKEELQENNRYRFWG